MRDPRIFIQTIVTLASAVARRANPSSYRAVWCDDAQLLEETEEVGVEPALDQPARIESMQADRGPTHFPAGRRNGRSLPTGQQSCREFPRIGTAPCQSTCDRCPGRDLGFDLHMEVGE